MRLTPQDSRRQADETIDRVADERTYPQRPYLAVSAAIIRNGKVLIVRRARSPALNLYTLPGGTVELGEALTDAVIREVREETALTIEPVAPAGHREVIARDARGHGSSGTSSFCVLPRDGSPANLFSMTSLMTRVGLTHRSSARIGPRMVCLKSSPPPRRFYADRPALRLCPSRRISSARTI